MIRVLVVDDSAIVRDLLSQGLATYPDIEVIGTAPDPYIARNKIVSEKPDVVTLDIEMPRMDGLSFLRKLMDYHPLPVIIVSSVSAQDKSAALEALGAGAFEVVDKPNGNLSVAGVIDQVAAAVRAAYENRAQFRTRQLAAAALRGNRSTPAVASKPAAPSLAGVKTTDTCIAVGASTGGTVALEYVLSSLPANLPPLVVVQHMPRAFTAQFAQRLDGLSRLRVKEAADGELLQRGYAYIAPGGRHLEVAREGSAVHAVLTDGEKVQFQKPSVDVLFRSMAAVYGRNALGVLLTGMGRDGAEGLLAMKRAGARTVIQDEESSVVWGMPRAAFEIGAYDEVAPLGDVPRLMVGHADDYRGE